MDAPSNEPEVERGLPRLIWVLMRDTLIGALLGVAFAGVLLATNTGGLLQLIESAEDPVTPVAMFVVGFATLLGSLYAGAAAMLAKSYD